MGEIKYEIIRHIDVIESYITGWNKELNVVAWGDRPPKYDIRDWNPDHTQMTKGLTLHETELKNLFEILKGELE